MRYAHLLNQLSLGHEKPAVDHQGPTDLKSIYRGGAVAIQRPKLEGPWELQLQVPAQRAGVAKGPRRSLSAESDMRARESLSLKSLVWERR